MAEAHGGSLLTGARGASSHRRFALPAAGGGGGISLALEGRWTPALPPPVTEMLGASTHGVAIARNPTQEGWTSNVTRLTFTFAEDDPFCAGETLTWEYQLEGDRVSSEVVAETCPGAVSRDSWLFERQGVS